MIKRLSSRIFIHISYEVCLRARLARCPPLVWTEARKLGCTGCGKRITLTWIISQDLIKVGQLMMTEQNKPSTFLRTCLWSSHKSGFVLQSAQNPKIDHKVHHPPDPDAGCEEESGHNALSGRDWSSGGSSFGQVIDCHRRPWYAGLCLAVTSHSALWLVSSLCSHYAHKASL